MTLSIQDWTFDVDVAATMQYSTHLCEDHCECGYCRNYYGSVDDTYPALRPFFARFGVDLEGPVDFLPVEPTLCVISYAVCGRIVKQGCDMINVDGTTLTVHPSHTLDYQLSCKTPYFVLTTGFLELPWILEEDMNEVVSPANEPECLERMYKKLLGNVEDEWIQS